MSDTASDDDIGGFSFVSASTPKHEAVIVIPTSTVRTKRRHVRVHTDPNDPSAKSRRVSSHSSSSKHRHPKRVSTLFGMSSRQNDHHLTQPRTHGGRFCKKDEPQPGSLAVSPQTVQTQGDSRSKEPVAPSSAAQASVMQAQPPSNPRAVGQVSEKPPAKPKLPKLPKRQTSAPVAASVSAAAPVAAPNANPSSEAPRCRTGTRPPQGFVVAARAMTPVCRAALAFSTIGLTRYPDQKMADGRPLLSHSFRHVRIAWQIYYDRRKNERSYTRPSHMPIALVTQSQPVATASTAATVSTQAQVSTAPEETIPASVASTSQPGP